MNLTPETGVEAFRRRARTEDGWDVVTMWCVRFGDRWVVECLVRPLDADEETVHHPGPYVFTTERAARAFADEATLALEYLGCEIS